MSRKSSLQPIRIEQHDKMNLTATVYHIARTHFNTRKGFLQEDIEDVLNKNKIDYSPVCVKLVLRMLAGQMMRYENRDEFKVKVLKKDGRYVKAGKNSYRFVYPYRYYVNNEGTIRVRPVDGKGYVTSNLTKTNVKNLAKLTNTRVTFKRFRYGGSNPLAAANSQKKRNKTMLKIIAIWFAGLVVAILLSLLLLTLSYGENIYPFSYPL